jgi:hypothetical protein
MIIIIIISKWAVMLHEIRKGIGKYRDCQLVFPTHVTITITVTTTTTTNGLPLAGENFYSAVTSPNTHCTNSGMNYYQLPGTGFMHEGYNGQDMFMFHLQVQLLITPPTVPYSNY